MQIFSKNNNFTENYQNRASGIAKTAIVLLIISLFSVAAGNMMARIYKKDSGILFSHHLHITDQEMDCSDCHAPLKDNLALMTMPDHDSCSSCHDVDEDDSCRKCHSDPDQETNFRKDEPIMSGVIFDHSQHSKQDISCDKCHEDTAHNFEVYGNELLPKMHSCVNCHNQKSVARDDGCKTCHEPGFENARPVSHTPNWMRTHGWHAEQDEADKDCRTCHTVAQGNDCITCHKQQSPRDHTLGFKIRGHAQKALLNRESCATCHQQDSCVSCHATNAPINHTPSWGGPSNRHCYGCHIEDNTGTSGSNCGYCHGSGIHLQHSKATPRSQPLHKSLVNNCTQCHKPSSIGSSGSIPGIPHFFKDEDTCVYCHR